MEKAELAMAYVGRSESEMERPARGCGEKQGVDFRDEVRHSEKNDQLFVKIMMKVDRKE